MGRRQRKRSRNKSRLFHTCDDGKEIVLLNSWLSKHGMRRYDKLVLAVFNDTGRGVLTKKKIYSGEELMNLPLNLTINVTTILMDNHFCNIFLENTRPCLQDYKHMISFQSLMAFYLAFLKVQSLECKWFVYLESLPKNYSVPYFLPNNVLCDIHDDILDVISKQKHVVNTSYNIFDEILKNTASSNINVNKLRDYFTLSLYEWAYFTVNTRCVYMDLTKVIDLKNIENSILNLICDNTKISLCPYLDMINHSPNAKNETKLMISRNLDLINVSNLNQELFLDVSFSIYTKNNFDPYTQVFICYGDSHNLKLITEYGFFLPDNDLDYISFTFEDIENFLNISGLKLSPDQVLFINSHGLNKNLYIDFKGLSYNFYGLLMVVKYYYNQTMDVSRLLYSAAICSDDKDLNSIVTPLVSDKLRSIKDLLSRLDQVQNKCEILDNCVALMCQYVKILENFNKC
ncbi:SET domain-containing protein 4 [Plodia interpunctella]|uniref:SET domain-containing protein 4 n=1 Tax=Plodia interpunctella TaxID=58824 RepID=UPI0023687962|nr:SET domain-containing protein 4 [Plodia interpunctella]